MHSTSMPPKRTARREYDRQIVKKLLKKRVKSLVDSYLYIEFPLNFYRTITACDV